MDVLSICIWVVLNVIVIASGFSFKNTPTCNHFIAILLGEYLTIDCSTTDPNSTSTLYHNNRRKNSTTSPVYKIHIDTSADGLYKCVAENQIGQKITWQCRILPYSSAKIETPAIDSRSEYPSGHSFNVTCHVKKDSGAKLDFYKSDTSSGNINQPITTRSALSVTLLFKNPSAMPKTRYTCVNSKDGVNKETYADISIKDQTPVRIIDFPKGALIVLKPSNQTVMSCQANGFPKPTLKWFKNGKELQPHTDSSNCKNGKNVICFIIKSPIYPKDEGNYSCVARNELGSWSTKSITAVFQFPPEIDDSSKEPVIVQGMKPKNLTCKIVKTKRQILPTFKWLQNPCTSIKDCKAANKWQAVAANLNQQPPPDNPTSTSTITVTKTVLNPMSYKCIATSILGSDSHIITFLRSRDTKPKLEIEGRVTFNAEGTLNLSCVLSGSVSYARWTKNGGKIHPSRNPRVSIRRHTNEDIYSEIVTLTIVNATVSDSGVYACKGKVKPGGSRIKAEEVVTVKALYKPKIINLPNITVDHGTKGETNIELKCHVASNPRAGITWSKLGSSLPPLQEKESCTSMVSGYYLKRTSEGTGNVLLICDADYRFTGWYTCKAHNKKGSDVKSAYVNILSAPNIISGSSYTVMYRSTGQSVDISCQATGNPLPTVTWTKRAPNGSIIAWREKTKSFSSVHISQLNKDDFGNYTCIATNSRGTDKMIINVKARAVPTALPGGHTQTIILASGIGGAIAFIFIVAVLACCLVYRRQKRLLQEYKAIKYLRSGEDYKLDPNRTILEQCEELPYDADWEFPVKRLIFQGIVGSGTFGQVMKAEAIGILSFSARDKTSDAFKRRSRLRRRLSSSRIYQDSTGNDYTRTTVAVKMLKAEASESDYKDLATELKIMIHLGEHTNIINLLGACTRTKQLMVIMEFALHGNLLNFLRSRREIYEATWRKTANNPDVEFTLADLVMYSYQIARGMDFLSSKKCVHRDLAARNVLIGEDYVMKIADFGLARDIYKSDVYVKETTGLLPVKWMAPESLFDRVYTHKTDVWSFGVVLWEMQTLGGTPYPGIPVEELMDYLSEGKRMRQPMDCPPEMYAIMRDCWLHKPSGRPPFSELVRRIERIIEKKISGQEPDEAYISVFMDEDLHRIYYLEPKDTFRDASQGNTPRNDNLQSLTEEEIQASPLPPVPCLSLEKIYKSSQDENDSHGHDTDTRYVQSPLSTTSSQDRGNVFDYQNLPPSPIRSNSRGISDHEKRVSACSTGVESGIEMEETLNDHSLGRRKPYNGITRPFDVEPRTSLLDSSVIKEKTKATML